jgi:hypothetical protein
MLDQGKIVKDDPAGTVVDYFRLGRTSKNTERIYFYAENIFYLYYCVAYKFNFEKHPDLIRAHDRMSAPVIGSFIQKCEKFIDAAKLLKLCLLETDKTVSSEVKIKIESLNKQILVEDLKIFIKEDLSKYVDFIQFV